VRFWTLVIRNLARRPLRSSLTAAGIAVALASFIALVGLSRGLERAWTGALHERDTHIFAVRKQSAQLLSGTIDERVAERVARLPGVSRVSGELFDIIELDTGETVLVIGWQRSSYLWDTLRLISGRLPAGEDVKETVMGNQIAEALNKHVGDTVLFNEAPFTVVGICASAGVMTGRAIMVPLKSLQTIQEKQGRVTVLHIRVERPDDHIAAAAVLDGLTRAFPDLGFSLSDEVADQNFFVRTGRAMSWGTSAIALLMALLMILNTLLMSVIERRHEIGVLTAVGWRARRILAMVVCEGLTLAGAGNLLGTGLGIVAMRWLTLVPQIRGFVEPQVTVRMVVEIALVTLVLGTVGSAYPAWRAIREDPVESLRDE
jgi:putative ABC transport system permease protein